MKSMLRLNQRLRAPAACMIAVFAMFPVGSTNAQTADEIFRGDFEPPPANDTCETATALIAGPSVQGTTLDATPNYDSGLETCTGYSQAGPDVAYYVFLGSGQHITVSLTPDASLDASISLLGPGAPSCNAVPVTCLAGSDSGAFGQAETFGYTTATSGAYYIIVDSYYRYGSDFTIQVTSP
jgi:hypothetical protein